MRDFLRYLYVVAAMLMVVVGDVWADCYYGIDSSVTEIDTDKHSEKEWWGTNTYYKFASTTEIGSVNNTYGISKITATITLERTSGGKNAKVKLEYSVDGGSWISLGDEKELAGTKVAWETDNKLEVSQNVDIPAGNTVKFRICETKQEEYGGSRKLTISNFNVTIASTMTAIPSSLDFGEINYGETPSSKSFKIAFSNIGTNVSASSDTEHFRVSPTSESIDCTGEKSFSVTYVPQNTGKHSGKITVTSTTGKSVSVEVYGTAKGAPEHTWNGSTEYLVGDLIDLANLWDTSNKENTPAFEIVDFDNYDATGVDPVLNGTSIELTRAGKLTVKIAQDATDTYFALSTTQVITVKKRTADFAWLLTEPSYHVDDNAELVNIYTLKDNATGADVLSELHDLITFESDKSSVVSIKQNSDEKWVVYAENAGEAKVTASFSGNYKWNAFTYELPLNVIKYTPVFTWNKNGTPYYYGSSIPNIFSTTNTDAECTVSITSDNEAFARVENNTLYIANLNETATVTVEQKENYKWYGLKKDYLITPVNGNTHVRIEINDESEYYLFKQSTTSGKVSWDGGVKFTQGDAGFNWDDTYYDIHFEGIPDKLTFDYDAQTGASEKLWFVCEKGSVEEEWVETEWSSTEDNGSASISLRSSTRYVRFCYSGNLSATINNIVVTEKKQFEASPNPLDFGPQGVDYGIQDKEVTFLHANAGRLTTAVIEGADKKNFSVDPMNIPGTGRDLHGTAVLKVYFNNYDEVRGEEPYNAVLVISDNSNPQNKIEIPLTGVRNGKSTPEFIWNPNALPYYFNTTIANIAYSTNKDPNCPLTYETSDKTIAEVIDGNLKIYNKGQEVTITVHQEENDNYKEHTETFTFTPCERPALEVPFRVSWSEHMKSVQVGSRTYWENDAQVRMGDALLDGFVWEDERKRILVTFGGVPDKLYFNYKATSGSTPQGLSYSWMVEESTNGVEWSEVWRSSNLSSSWTASGEIDLNPKTQYVRISYTGNFAGYVKDIIISSLEGHSYLRAEEGTYLSRGAKYGTQAVADPFGVVCRISHFTHDNVNTYSRFQFVDNMQYLWETHDTEELFTDDKTADNTANLWQVESDASGKFVMRSGNETNKGRYVTIKENALTFTDNPSEATIWHMESPSEHEQVKKKYVDEVATWVASKDFGPEVNTLEKLRSNIQSQDFEETGITIPAVALAQHAGEYRDDINGTLPAYDNTISGLEPGIYRLSVKAFYRISESKYAKEARNNTWESVLAYVYANEVKYPIQSVYDSHNQNSYHTSDELYNGYYYPTQLQPSAEQALGEVNRYLNNVYVYVEADAGKTTGTLSYGIKNPSFVPGAWLVYSTFTLTRIARQEYIFVGGDATYPKDWNTDENWNRKAVPNQNHSVIIQANAEVEKPNAVYSMSINKDINVHILSEGGLTIGVGGVLGATDGALTIDNTPTGAGFLKVDQSATNMPKGKVTINYTTEAYNSGNPRDEEWQYMGAPGMGMDIVADEDKTLIYHWSEQNGWEKQTNEQLTPFAGYVFTQNKGTAEKHEANFEIKATPIFENETVELTCTPNGMRGGNVFANSYLAPIDVAKIDPANDLVDVEGTFYLFNSGSWNQWQSEGGKDHMNYGVSPGQYYALSPKGASLMDQQYDQTTIPPMQGAYVVATSDNAQIKLDYAKHVYDAAASNTAMRAPQKRGEDFKRVRLQVNSQNSGADRMYVIQHEDATKGYDYGYDAKNIAAEDQVNIYTTEQGGEMEISVSNRIDSTYIGFQAGSDSEYRLRITSVVGEKLLLKDLETETVVAVEDEVEYTFSATPKSVNNKRFLLIDQLAGEEIDDLVKVYIYDNVVHVLEAPKDSDMAVYSVGGLLMARYEVGETPCTVELSGLPTGVYLVRIADKAFKFVCK